MTTTEGIWLRLEELSDQLLDSLEPKCAAMGFNTANGNAPLNEAILDVKKFRDHWRYITINGKQTLPSERIQIELLAQLTELCRYAKAVSSGTNNIPGFTTAAARLLSLCWRRDLKDFFFVNQPEQAVKCTGLEKWIELHQAGTLWRRIKKWFSSFRMSRKNKRWAEIAEEVIERKTLWLTAAAELKAKGVPGVDTYKVSATDVFVEKAQMAISNRAVRYQVWGAIVAGVTVTLMILVCVFLYQSLGDLLTINKIISEDPKVAPVVLDYPPLQFVIIVLRMLTIGALMAGIGYFLIGIARALLHEGTALYSRRHALRFGRLYVYLKGGEIKDVDELEKAFKWNDAVHTAFSDIRAEKAAKSITHMLSEVGLEAIKVGASAKEKFRDKREEVK